jgi:hypothetical protein
LLREARRRRLIGDLDFDRLSYIPQISVRIPFLTKRLYLTSRQA